MLHGSTANDFAHRKVAALRQVIAHRKVAARRKLAVLRRRIWERCQGRFRAVPEIVKSRNTFENNLAHSSWSVLQSCRASLSQAKPSERQFCGHSIGFPAAHAVSAPATQQGSFGNPFNPCPKSMTDGCARRIWVRPISGIFARLKLVHPACNQLFNAKGSQARAAHACRSSSRASPAAGEEAASQRRP